MQCTSEVALHMLVQSSMLHCADLEVQMSHDVFDFLTSVVSVLDTGVCFGNGEQQGGVQSPTLCHAVKLCIHLLQASNLHHKQSRGSEPMETTYNVLCHFMQKDED